MRQIGPYTVREELGRGGMGVVYRAKDPAGREVALKVLPRGEGERQAQRFEREIEALAGFTHPNVVRVHTAGHTDGEAYYVMDVAHGGSLSGRVARGGAYAPRDAAQLALALADAMIAAHDYGVLHRDLKPDNVLFNDAGIPLISDFGLARQLVADSKGLTESGRMLGSPGYMAPEQVVGDRDEQGAGTDVYGLGATLYFALTGHAPFEGAQLPGLLRATVDDPPTPPSEHTAAVSAELDELVLRCLEKDPDARFASMRALRDALATFLAGDLRSLRRRNLVRAVVIACATAAGTGAVLWGWFHQSPLEPAVHPRIAHRPPGDNRPAPAPAREAQRPLTVAWDVAREQARSLLAARDLDEALRHFDHARALAPDGEVFHVDKERLSAYSQRMQRRWSVADHAGAEADARTILQASEPYTAAARGDGEPVLGGLLDLGKAAELRGYNARAHWVLMRLARRAGDLETALRESELSLGADREVTVIHEQAWVLHRLGDDARAVAQLRACCLGDLSPLDEGFHEPQGFLLLAALARERGDEDAAQTHLDRAARTISRYGQHEAAILREPGRRAELERTLRATLRRPEPSPAYWTRVGRMAWDCRQLDAAEQAFVQALDFDPEHAPALEAWADLNLELARWPRAAEHARRLSQLEGAEAEGFARLAEALDQMTRWEEALSAARAALDHDSRLHLGRTGAVLATALAFTGRRADSERALQPLLDSSDLRVQTEAYRARLRIGRYLPDRNKVR